MAQQITYTNKVTGEVNPAPEINKFTAPNANEIKTVVNNNATQLDSLDGTNIELIKGGGIYIDDAIIDLQGTKLDIGGDIGGTVTSPTINDEAITNAKLAHISTNRIKGRSSAGSGDVEDLTVPQTKTMLAIDQVDNTSDANKPISIATADALNTLDLDLDSLDNAKISKNVGATYTTNALTTVTQAEYDAIPTHDSNTIYFIV